MIKYIDVEQSAGLPCFGLPDALSQDRSGRTLTAWITAQRSKVLEVLNRYGAIVFREFAFGGAGPFQEFASVFCSSLQNYVGGNSPRTRVDGNVFSTTEYPSSARISMHNEASYLPSMPRRILFYCVTPPNDRGQTPLADSRRIYKQLRPGVREKFEAKGVKYVNNLNGGMGVGRSWQAVFQTNDRRAVEKYLESDGYQYEWKKDGGLRTSIVAPAVATHPETNERVWINQAEQWHPSSLDLRTRSAMASVMSEEDFPHNALFGDGAPLDEADLAHIREVMANEERIFRWAAEDVLVCDNFLVMHGREPFSGPRKILCAFG